MKRLFSNRAFTRTAVLLAALGCVILVCAVIRAASKTEPVYDYDRHEELLDLEITSLRDLAQDYLWQQLRFLPVALPNVKQPMFQPGGYLPLLDQAYFSDSFIKELAGTNINGIVRFPILVYEDGDSGEIVVENMLAEEIARIRRESGYRSDWFVRRKFDNLDDFPTEHRDWLIACYDPARIVIDYDLILDKENLIRLVWRETILSAAAEEEEEGGEMEMRWGGGAVTNLELVEIERTTNHVGITVTLAYPEEYQTNTVFEFYTCWDLIEEWWDPGPTTNTDTSTNWVQWTDSAATNWYETRRMYAAAVQDDQDDDGFKDGMEHFVYHTDPEDSNSYPVEVSGEITYSGPQTGRIWMVSTLSSNIWTGCSGIIPSPAGYTNDRVAVSSNYWFKAFRDSNWNRQRDVWEAQGIYTNTSTTVTNDLTGIDIVLDDPDDDDDGLPDWWEYAYFGNTNEAPGDDTDSDGLVNSNEYTLSTDPSDPDTDDDFLVDGYDGYQLATNYPAGTDANASGYVDGEYDFGADPLDVDSDDDSFGDGFEVACSTDPTNVLSYPATLSGTISYSGGQTGPVRVIAVNAADSWASNLVAEIAAPGAYTVSNVPTLNTWWLKAFRDSDGNDGRDDIEAWGACLSNSFYVSTNMTGLDITLDDPDLDADNLADWWELFHFQTMAYTGADDVDGDGAVNSNEYNNWINPTDPTLADTDSDGVTDGSDDNPTASEDLDGDGLPDDWENYWLTTNAFAGGTNDYDADTMTDTQEYVTGTDPTHADGNDTNNVTLLKVFSPLE